MQPPPEEDYIAPPKKQDKRKKFKLEKPAPAQIEEQSVQSSVQEQLVRAEPPPDQSFKRQNASVSTAARRAAGQSAASRCGWPLATAAGLAAAPRARRI